MEQQVLLGPPPPPPRRSTPLYTDPTMHPSIHINSLKMITIPFRKSKEASYKTRTIAVGPPHGPLTLQYGAGEEFDIKYNGNMLSIKVPPLRKLFDNNDHHDELLDLVKALIHYEEQYKAASTLEYKRKLQCLLDIVFEFIVNELEEDWPMEPTALTIEPGVYLIQYENGMSRVGQSESSMKRRVRIEVEEDKLPVRCAGKIVSTKDIPGSVRPYAERIRSLDLDCLHANSPYRDISRISNQLAECYYATKLQCITRTTCERLFQLPSKVVQQTLDVSNVLEEEPCLFNRVIQWVSRIKDKRGFFFGSWETLPTGNFKKAYYPAHDDPDKTMLRCLPDPVTFITQLFEEELFGTDTMFEDAVPVSPREQIIMDVAYHLKVLLKTKKRDYGAIFKQLARLQGANSEEYIHAESKDEADGGHEMMTRHFADLDPRKYYFIMERRLWASISKYYPEWLDDLLEHRATLRIMPRDFLSLYETKEGHQIFVINSYFLAAAVNVPLLLRFIATRGLVVLAHVLDVSGVISHERFIEIRNRRLSFLMDLEFGRSLDFDINDITGATPELEDQCLERVDPSDNFDDDVVDDVDDDTDDHGNTNTAMEEDYLGGSINRAIYRLLPDGNYRCDMRHVRGTAGIYKMGQHTVLCLHHHLPRPLFNELSMILGVLNNNTDALVPMQHGYVCQGIPNLHIPGLCNIIGRPCSHPMANQQEEDDDTTTYIETSLVGKNEPHHPYAGVFMCPTCRYALRQFKSEYFRLIADNFGDDLSPEEVRRISDLQKQRRNHQVTQDNYQKRRIQKHGLAAVKVDDRARKRRVNARKSDEQHVAKRQKVAEHDSKLIAAGEKPSGINRYNTHDSAKEYPQWFYDLIQLGLPLWLQKMGCRLENEPIQFSTSQGLCMTTFIDWLLINFRQQIINDPNCAINEITIYHEQSNSKKQLPRMHKNHIVNLLDRSCCDIITRIDTTTSSNRIQWIIVPGSDLAMKLQKEPTCGRKDYSTMVSEVFEDMKAMPQVQQILDIIKTIPEDRPEKKKTTKTKKLLTSYFNVKPSTKSGHRTSSSGTAVTTNKKTSKKGGRPDTKVIQFTSDWEMVRTYNSIKEAEESVAKTKGHISKACSGSAAKSLAGGYHWMKENDYRDAIAAMKGGGNDDCDADDVDPEWMQALLIAKHESLKEESKDRKNKKNENKHNNRRT